MTEKGGMGNPVRKNRASAVFCEREVVVKMWVDFVRLADVTCHGT